VLFCVMCVIFALCLTVVPLSPGENQFVVKINNNKITLLSRLILKVQCIICPIRNKDNFN
jgi:hypothetical protein